MKSVTFSEIERVRQEPRPYAAYPAQRVAVLGFSLVMGLPMLVLAFHLLDPDAPLGYVVLPVLLGGALPLARSLHGRLEVATRFSACHLVGTLDDTLDELGYAPAERTPGTLRYHARTARFAHWRNREIVVTVRDHALELTGPVPALRALRRRLAC